MILFDKIIGGAAIALLVASGVQTWRLHRLQLNHAETVAQYQSERAAAAAVAREAEAAYRQREQELQAKVNQVEAKSAKELALRDARIKSLRLAGDGLRNQLAAYTARSSGPADDPAAALRDLQNRVETLGLLVAERDAMAGESEEYAEAVGPELAICRAYADAVIR